MVLRTVGGAVPDRLGGRVTVAVLVGLEAFGMLGYTSSATSPLAVAALIALCAGQAMAVPSRLLWACSRWPRFPPRTMAQLSACSSRGWMPASALGPP